MKNKNLLNVFMHLVKKTTPIVTLIYSNEKKRMPLDWLPKNNSVMRLNHYTAVMETPDKRVTHCYYFNSQEKILGEMHFPPKSLVWVSSQRGFIRVFTFITGKLE